VYGSNFGDPERKPSLLGKLSKLPAPRLHWLEPRQSPPVLEPQSWSCPDKLQPSTPTSAHHVTPHSPAIEVQAALRGLSLFHTHTLTSDGYRLENKVNARGHANEHTSEAKI